MLSSFPDNVRVIQFVALFNNGLLLDLAKDFEQQALSLYDRATEVDEKWRIRLESKRKVAIQK